MIEGFIILGLIAIVWLILILAPDIIWKDKKEVNKMSDKINLDDILECFSRLKNEGYKDLKFVLFEDGSGSIRNYLDKRIIHFEDLNDLKRILLNMDIL